ncbi:hypothetical protein LINPERHAP2_LOCUS8419 [Linum perenne]
MRNIPAS